MVHSNNSNNKINKKALARVVKCFSPSGLWNKLAAFLASLKPLIELSLQGRDQRERCVLNVIKHAFQPNSALLTTNSALTTQYCTLRGRITLKKYIV